MVNNKIFIVRYHTGSIFLRRSLRRSRNPAAWGHSMNIARASSFSRDRSSEKIDGAECETRFCEKSRACALLLRASPAEDPARAARGYQSSPCVSLFVRAGRACEQIRSRAGWEIPIFWKKIFSRDLSAATTRARGSGAL